VYDLPDDHYAEFVPRVEAITRDEVSRVMTDYLDPAGLTTLVVGDLNTFGPELARAGFAEPLVLSADTF
jgi:predicted Zn-dependent peptidase